MVCPQDWQYPTAHMCVCACEYIWIYSLCEFLILRWFSFCAHMLALCSKSSDLSSACRLHANVCAQMHSFKGDRQSWIRLSSWHLIHSRSLSLPLPCVLIRLWDVKPRLSFEAIHTLHSNNVLLPCTPSSVSTSFLAFLNITSPHLQVQKSGLDSIFHLDINTGSTHVSPPILFLLTMILSLFPTVLHCSFNHDFFRSLPLCLRED